MDDLSLTSSGSKRPRKSNPPRRRRSSSKTSQKRGRKKRTSRHDDDDSHNNRSSDSDSDEAKEESDNNDTNKPKSKATSKSSKASSKQGSGKKGRPVVQLADDADEVLFHCRRLRAALRRDVPKTKKKTKKRKKVTGDDEDEISDSSSSGSSSADLSYDSSSSQPLLEPSKHTAKQATTSASGTATEVDMDDVVEVKEMKASQVMQQMEHIALRAAATILKNQGVTFDVPSRSASNQVYIPQLDRIVLGPKTGTRSFLHVKECRKTAITARVLQLLHQILQANIHITKRDLFYTDVKLFHDQSESDNVLDDVATMVGCTRSNLHVVASDKGLVVGRISFVEDGDFIDCTKMGVGGKAIPPYVDKIERMESDAEFVLLVEKEAAYMRMAEDRFYHRYPCIIITAKGQPDVATRMFLSRLKRELKIPILGLVDSDPYGLKILSVYMSGSKNMSYDSASLTTPDIKWLGLRPSDLDKYDLPNQCRLSMTENDIKTGKELLREEFIRKNPEWMKELELMVKTKEKAEIQALSSFGFQYITQVYLPKKLREGDWI